MDLVDVLYCMGLAGVGLLSGFNKSVNSSDGGVFFFLLPCLGPETPKMTVIMKKYAADTIKNEGLISLVSDHIHFYRVTKNGGKMATELLIR
jgi:hypothetical protein